MNAIIITMAAMRDSVGTVRAIPNTATEYLKLNFIELGASILLMFILASFLLWVVKRYTMKKCEKVNPKSVTNEKVTVIESRLSEGWWLVVLTAIIILSMVTVRGAFGGLIAFYPFTREILLAIIEMLVSFGALSILVPRFGAKAAENLAYTFIKSQMDKDAAQQNMVVTPKEYMELGTPEETKTP